MSCYPVPVMRDFPQAWFDRRTSHWQDWPVTAAELPMVAASVRDQPGVGR